MRPAAEYGKANKLYSCFVVAAAGRVDPVSEHLVDAIAAAKHHDDEHRRDEYLVIA